MLWKKASRRPKTANIVFGGKDTAETAVKRRRRRTLKILLDFNDGITVCHDFFDRRPAHTTLSQRITSECTFRPTQTYALRTQRQMPFTQTHDYPKPLPSNFIFRPHRLKKKNETRRAINSRSAMKPNEGESQSSEKQPNEERARVPTEGERLMQKGKGIPQQSSHSST